MARERRDRFHVQIEDIVARTWARRDAGNEAKLAQQVGTLVTADIRHMAGQARHDILAAAAAAMADRTWSSPLADLILDQSLLHFFFKRVEAFRRIELP